MMLSSIWPFKNILLYNFYCMVQVNFTIRCVYLEFRFQTWYNYILWSCVYINVHNSKQCGILIRELVNKTFLHSHNKKPKLFFDINQFRFYCLYMRFFLQVNGTLNINLIWIFSMWLHKIKNHFNFMNFYINKKLLSS